jgi:pyridoxine 5-phosphate synthase
MTFSPVSHPRGSTLSVNIDHIATLREARKELFPDPIRAAAVAERAGADGITIHLRMDQRHIKERDLRSLKHCVKTELNLEMAVTEKMVGLALAVRPDRVSLVPEQAGEITTQGGLDLRKAAGTGSAIKRLKAAGMRVSIFIDPQLAQIRLARRLGADMIEINTARYSVLKNRRAEVRKIARLARMAQALGLAVHAGHGIDCKNIVPLLKIPEISGFSIGFSIVARAVFVGLPAAVREMKRTIARYRP